MINHKLTDQRVREIRKGLGATQADFARILNVTQMTISHIENGAMSLSAECSRILENYYGLPRNALRTSDHLPVPIIGSAAAGKPTFSAENFDGFVSMYNINDYEFGEVVAVNVIGDSMEQRIYSGDIAYVHLQDNIDSCQIGAFSYQDGIIIKQFKLSDNYVELHSINKAYKPIVIDEQETNFRILGKVIGVFSKI